jgi:uncharacterized protein
MNARRVVVVVGKAPEPGRTKTRLSPPLSLQEAADLYRAFLLDTTAVALALEWERVTLVHPDDQHMARQLAELVPTGARLQPQAGTGLGAALCGAFESHVQAGFDRVVLIGSDTPTLPATYLRDACAALERYDVVLGPSQDGGYYLLGSRGFHPALFENITWSTSLVCAQTLARAAAAGLSVWCMPTWYDVDTPRDLTRLRHHLRHLSPDVAPLTRRQLATLGALLTDQAVLDGHRDGLGAALDAKLAKN